MEPVTEPPGWSDPPPPALLPFHEAPPTIDPPPPPGAPGEPAPSTPATRYAASSGGVPPVVLLDGVGRQFPSEPPVDALIDVHLRVEAGEYMAIVGPSGSGKSTLLNLLGLLDSPTSGQYILDGLDTTVMSDAQRTAQRARRIGFVFQSFHLLSHRTVEENVSLGELYQSRNQRRRRIERAREVLVQVGLGHRLGFTPQRLSGGERQRVAIARALVGQPSLLLCDEPTGNLDSRTTAQILDLFDELRVDGLTVLLITHDPNVAARAGRQVRIVDGRLYLPEPVGHVG